MPALLVQLVVHPAYRSGVGRFDAQAGTLFLSCQLMVKGGTLNTAELLRLNLPRKSVIRKTDRSGTASAVLLCHGREAINQANNHRGDNRCISYC